MSARKSSHRTIFLIVSSGSPLALIASSLRSTSKKPFCPMTRSLHPPIPRAVIESDSWGVGERDFSRCPFDNGREFLGGDWSDVQVAAVLRALVVRNRCGSEVRPRLHHIEAKPESHKYKSK